jgi:hypothetical protein
MRSWMNVSFEFQDANAIEPDEMHGIWRCLIWFCRQSALRSKSRPEHNVSMFLLNREKDSTWRRLDGRIEADFATRPVPTHVAVSIVQAIVQAGEVFRIKPKVNCKQSGNRATGDCERSGNLKQC